VCQCNRQFCDLGLPCPTSQVPVQALGSCTFSHFINIASTDAFADYLNTPGFVANPNIDRGDSDFDIRHSFTAGVTYTLPSPEWNKFARATLGGAGGRWTRLFWLDLLRQST